MRFFQLFDVLLELFAVVGQDVGLFGPETQGVLGGCDSCSAGPGVVQVLEDEVLVMVLFPVFTLIQSIEEIPL